MAPTMLRRFSLAFALLAVGAGGCSQPPSPAPPTNSPPAAAAPSAPANEEQIERLRSLGYLDTKGLPKLGAGKGVRSLDSSLASPGYTLVVFAGACTCQLISLDGEIVRSWKDEPCHRWEHAELLPDGDLVVVGARLDQDVAPDPIESGRYVMRLGWNGERIWRAEINAHHDITPTADGKLMTLVLKRRRVAAIDPDRDFADELMTLLTPEGKTVASVSLYDVLSSADPPFRFQKAGGTEGAHRIIDIFHCNAIRLASLPGRAGKSSTDGPGTVLLTSRHQDEVMLVDWSSRRLLWHWGRGVLSGPHEASMLPNGRILVFDNGLSRGWSRVLEVDPRAPDQMVQYAPAAFRFFTRVMGSCQRLPNGNTLIVHSEGGAAFELTPQGTTAWTYEGTLKTPDGHRVKLIRMRRIPTAVVDEILSRRGR
jgi:arylsulfotransferase ASST